METLINKKSQIKVGSKDVLARKEEILKLAEEYKLKNVTLFGSVARGEETENSDIDIAVSSDDINGYFGRRICFENDLSEMFGKKVEVSAIENINPIVKKRLIKEGIKL